MTNTAPPPPEQDFHILIQKLYEISFKSQQLILEALLKGDPDTNTPDPLNITSLFSELIGKLLQNPNIFMEMQKGFIEDSLKLWQELSKKSHHLDYVDVVQETEQDKRFLSKEWTDNIVFNHHKQRYLLYSKWIMDAVQKLPYSSIKVKRKILFHTQFWLNSISPSNYILTNPDIIKKTMDTQGQNLIDGMENLHKDIQYGKGRLRITMTDPKAFKVGKSLAITKGHVVFQNKLMQLIHYEPSTIQQYQDPLLIIPPWINKFYILDLQQQNSYVKWALDQGYSVFMISWVNPTKDFKETSFEDYLRLGPLEALKIIQHITQQSDLHCVGYCLGGTLLSILLAYCAAHHISMIKSATFLTAMVDFQDAGDLSIFIDDQQLDKMNRQMEKKGYLDPMDMAMTFNMLRSQDLIWSFIINNYLLGNKPKPYDFLYWNNDSTAMPADMHSYYLRNMYHENNLSQKNKLSFLDTPIDLSLIEIPCFFLATLNDHIAPWQSVYKTTQLIKGKSTFHLSKSGHIAGVINPPSAQKYGYWTQSKTPENPDDWLKGTTYHSGSWWPAWAKWLHKIQNKEKSPALPCGKNIHYPPLEAAPGSYVKIRL